MTETAAQALPRHRRKPTCSRALDIELWLAALDPHPHAMVEAGAS